MSDSLDQYNRRMDWQIFDVHTPVYASAANLRKRLEEDKLLEKQIEAAAELLIRRIGSLTIVAISEGRDHIPLLQASEFDFLHDLPSSGADISEGHKRMLKDMEAVRYKLSPLVVKAVGHRAAPLSRAQLWTLCDRLDAALITLRRPSLGDVLGYALMKEVA